MYFFTFAIYIILRASLYTLFSHYLKRPPSQDYSQKHGKQHHNQNKDASLFHGRYVPEGPKGILKDDEREKKERAEAKPFFSCDSPDIFPINVLLLKGACVEELVMDDAGEREPLMHVAVETADELLR
jgi:hypothetical protein